MLGILILLCTLGGTVLKVELDILMIKYFELLTSELSAALEPPPHPRTTAPIYPMYYLPNIPALALRTVLPAVALIIERTSENYISYIRAEAWFCRY